MCGFNPVPEGAKLYKKFIGLAMKTNSKKLQRSGPYLISDDCYARMVIQGGVPM